jgi:tetratricopeptide (TPR) repeat protein
MADITLRDYFAKLDTLLNNGASSEVIHHCRHILQYFPKNAEAYRYLGRALVDTKSWREADEVLRRLLSVYPDDFYAYAGLSEVSLADNRPDDAIWFMERAFEQNPNNKDVLEALRELYRKHRQVEYAKVNLTAGAVARQYIRNGLYPQAITTLQQALERSPDRIDLKLMLARTYWDGGQRVEAAEAALNVLKTLPDCLEANRILAELWLSESRPSDAQRYISNIQSVDPYLALRLAKGQDIPSDAYKLEELDYRRAAERENVTRSPDWLEQVDQAAEASSSSEAAPDWMGTLRSRGVEEEEAPPALANENFSSPPPGDWFSAVPEAAPAADEPPPAPRKRTGLTGLLSGLNEPQPAAEPEPVPDELPDLAAIAPAAQAPDAADLFPDDIFSDEDPTPVPTTRQTGALRESDPLAWLKESGIELTDAPQAAENTDLYGSEEDNFALQSADQMDPLAWLKSSGGEDMIAPSDEPEAAMADQPADDPLAWLKGSSADTGEEASHPASGGVKAQDTGDALDWLADESLLDEALNLEALTEFPQVSSEQRMSGAAAVPAMAEEPDRQDEMPNEKDNAFDWMNEDSTKAASESGEFTWASDQSALSDDEVPDLFADLGSDEEAQRTGDALDWMSELDHAQPSAAQGNAPDWFSSMGSDELTAPEPTAQSADDVPDWLSQAQPEEPVASSESQASESDMPDWLSQMGPEEPAAVQPAAQSPSADDSGFEWMSADTEAEVAGDMPDWLSQAQPEEATASSDAPDWLSQVEPEEPAAVQPTAQSASADDSGFEWMSEDTEAEPAGDMPDWLSQAQPEEPAASDTPDWLSQVEPEEPAAAQPAAQSPSADDSGFEWMSADTAAEPAGDMPDWLSQAQPEEAAAASDAPDWLSQVEPEEPAAVQPAAQSASVDNSGFEWMSDDTAAEPAGEMPDWLSQAQPEEAAAASDAPDWLSQIEPEEPAAAEPVAQSASADEDEFEWMSADTGAEAAGDIPDWLSQAQPEEAAAASDAPDWLSQIEPEEPAAAEPVAQSPKAGEDISSEAVGETPEWLTALESDESTADQDAQPQGETPDWLSELQQPDTEPAEQAMMEEAGVPWEDEDADLEEEPAGDMPDWLDRVKSSRSQVPEEPVEEKKATSEYGWINEIEEATPETAASRVEFVDDDVAAGEKVLADVEGANNAPDWLNAMVPGLDVDYEAPEDEQIEEEFLPGSENRVVPVFQSAAQPARSREFDWLVDIVEEETQQMRVVEGKPQRGRFTFSRPPLWLRRPTEKRDHPDNQPVVDDGDWSDVDLPPWLQ